MADNSYESGLNLGGISVTNADGSVDEKQTIGKINTEKVAEDARATNGNKGQSVRENIADYLPDSRLKDSMLRKAEANREKRRVIDERKKAGEMTPRELKRSTKEGERRDKRMDKKYPGEREQAQKDAQEALSIVTGKQKKKVMS